MKILIVEDEPELAVLLQRFLNNKGFSSDIQSRADNAMEAIRNTKYVAVILDRGLPDGDGLCVIRRLLDVLPAKKIPPFLILSALGDSAHKVEGLTQGAIDYMVKPYNPDELLARLKICIASKTGLVDKKITLGNIVYDVIQKSLLVSGQKLYLRRRELAIFDLLIRHKENVVSHDRVEDYVYGLEDGVYSNALAVHVSRLRKSLEEAGAKVSLKVMRNIGYILEAAD